MKNIMTLLKEQKEAKKCSKKKDKGYRRILYPKTKADLIAGKNMNRIIGKAINNYQEFTRSAVLRGILKPSVSSVDRDEELQDIDTVDTAQDSSITEFVSTTEHSTTEEFMLRELDTVIPTTKELENIEFIDANKDSVMTELTNVAQESENIDTIDTTEHIPNHSNSQDELPVCKHKYWETLALLTNLGQEKFNVTSGLLTLKYTNKSKIKLKELLITSQNSRNKPNKLFAINFIKLPVSKPNVSSELSEFNKVVGVTGCENLDTDDSGQTVKLQKFNNAPVVTFIKRPVSKPQKFNKSFPVVHYAILNTSDPNSIPISRSLNNAPVVNKLRKSPKLQNLNDSPVVSFIKQPISKIRTSPKLRNLNKSPPVVNDAHRNTPDPDAVLRLHRFNNPPVVTFIKLNTKDPNTIQKLQNLNKFLPVVDLTHLSTADQHLISRLRKFNNAPVVNELRKSPKLQSLNNPPPVVDCPNLNLSDLNTVPALRKNLNKSSPVVGYARQSTTDPDQYLKSYKFNKSPVVNELRKSPKLQNLNKSFPVVQYPNLNLSDRNTVPALRNFNKSPMVNDANFNITDPNTPLKLQSLNKSPPLLKTNVQPHVGDPIVSNTFIDYTGLIYINSRSKRQTLYKQTSPIEQNPPIKIFRNKRWIPY